MIRLISAPGKVHWPIVILAINVLIIVMLIVAWMRSSPQTIKECILEQMRGQPDNMRAIAIRVCQERHPGDYDY